MAWAWLLAAGHRPGVPLAYAGHLLGDRRRPRCPDGDRAHPAPARLPRRPRGILLPGEPGRLTARRGPAVLIPWADVEQIILYSSEPGEQAPVQRIGIQRRIGAMEARKVTGWRLDRGRLAAVTATVAQGVRIVCATANPGRALKDRARQQVRPGSDPSIKTARPCHPRLPQSVDTRDSPHRAGNDGARARSGQAPALPLVSDRRGCRLRRSRAGPEDHFCGAVRNDLRVPLTVEGRPGTLSGPSRI